MSASADSITARSLPTWPIVSERCRTCRELRRRPHGAAARKFDLVLVNRVLDLDGSSGLELIQTLKEDPDQPLKATPVMLVSDYPEAAADGRRAGREPGFGKSELQSPATLGSAQGSAGLSLTAGAGVDSASSIRCGRRIGTPPSWTQSRVPRRTGIMPGTRRGSRAGSRPASRRADAPAPPRAA